MKPSGKNDLDRKPRTTADLIKMIEHHGGIRTNPKTKKHFKYKLPNGTIFVIPATPSDHRSLMNSHAVLKRLLDQPPHDH